MGPVIMLEIRRGLHMNEANGIGRTMKNNIFILGLTAAVFSSACIALAEDAPSESPVHDIDIIASTDPSEISESQFYDYELALISGYSGSGVSGYKYGDNIYFAGSYLRKY